jgi:flagellin-like protein
LTNILFDSPMLRTKRALSPVIATVILLAVVIAVAIATVAWMSGLTFSFTDIEELRITNEHWGPDCSYVDLTLRNGGTTAVTINSVTVNSQSTTSFTFISGSETIAAGETAVVRLTETFVPQGKYLIAFSTMKGNSFFSYLEARLLASSFRMEWGTTTVNDTFKTVYLQNSYESPIIVCSPSYNSGLPRTVRLRDVSSESFMVRLQNPSGSIVPDTVVHYLVVEEGVWESPFKIEAVKYSTSTVGENNNWNYDLRSYGESYSGNVIVLHQAMSYNDPTWITTYVSKADSRTSPPSSGDTGFRIALNGAEAVDTHGAEDIGYIIIQECYDVLNGINWEAKQTSDTIQGLLNSPPYNTSFDQTFTEPPNVVLAFQQEMDGNNGGWALVYSTSSTQLGLACDEDQVNDSERSHTTETCGFVVFESTGSYVE